MDIRTPPTFRPDIIVSWPRNCDYPLWRNFIRNNRPRFNEVIVVFTETNAGDDYRDFVRSAMQSDYVHFIDSRPILPGEDWRDVAVNEALVHSYNSEWIWFTEQDFYITDEKFWNEIYYKAMAGFDLMAIAQQGRIHPACIFIKREILDQTSKNFGANPPEWDHFGLLQKELEELQIYRVLLADEDAYGYKHFNGLSHNWHLINQGQEPNYNPGEFAEYLKQCIALPAKFEMDTRFVKQAQKAITAYVQKKNNED